MKPRIICYMMTTLDGRIDCSMLEKMPGEEYDEIFRELGIQVNLNGKVTAEMECAEKGEYQVKDKTPVGKITVSKKTTSSHLDLFIDSQGKLLWKENKEYKNPHVILLSEDVSKEYLEYLDEKHLSYIVCGKGKVDLKEAMSLLNEYFYVKELAVTGGGLINGAFLEAGLLDEVDILLAPGIDGRANMRAAFDGLECQKLPHVLKLLSVKQYPNGNLWLKYSL